MKPLRLQGTATITYFTTFFTPLNFTRNDLGCIKLDQLNSLTNFSKHQPSVHMCVCVCVCVSVSLSVCLFTFEVLFKRLFSPTSQSWMSKIFRDLESLGKNNGKKWYEIWKLLLVKGVKSLHKKSLFLGEFCLNDQDFFGIGVSHSV